LGRREFHEFFGARAFKAFFFKFRRFYGFVMSDSQ